MQSLCTSSGFRVLGSGCRAQGRTSGIGTLVAMVMVRVLSAPGHGMVWPICICDGLKSGSITYSGSLVMLTFGTTAPDTPGRAASHTACKSDSE